MKREMTQDLYMKRAKDKSQKNRKKMRMVKLLAAFIKDLWIVKGGCFEA